MVLESGFAQLGYYFQTYGVMDFLLPFILVFTIIFAVLEKTKLLGDKKNFNVVISLVLGLMFVVPHVMGVYPLGYDPVAVMNASLPSVALVAVASIMLLILMGIFGTKFTKSASPIIAILAIIFVAYVFGSSLSVWTGPSDFFYWWSPQLTELIIILLVFGLIVWFVVKDPKDKSTGSNITKSIGKLFEKE